MGKMLLQQRRGKGSPVWRAAKYNIKERISYVKGIGQIVDIVDDPRYNVPVAIMKLENGEEIRYLCPEGVGLNKKIYIGENAELEYGNAVPLGQIPDGTPIFNIESVPGDGGKFIRSAGGYGIVVSKKGNDVVVKMPSRKMKTFNAKCLATIGIAAGAGAKEKPMLKAGKNYHKRRARGRKYPDVRGVKMNAYNHPYGGKGHHAGKPTTVARNTPPGRKVGHIAARRTGRRKGRIEVV